MIALGASLLALYIGVSPIRFWWHGLAMLIVGALACGVLATVVRINDPLVNSAPDFRIEAGWIMAGLAVMFAQMLFWYGVGALARHVKRSMSEQSRSNQSE